MTVFLSLIGRGRQSIIKNRSAALSLCNDVVQMSYIKRMNSIFKKLIIREKSTCVLCYALCFNSVAYNPNFREF